MPLLTTLAVGWPLSHFLPNNQTLRENFSHFFNCQLSVHYYYFIRKITCGGLFINLKKDMRFDTVLIL